MKVRGRNEPVAADDYTSRIQQFLGQKLREQVTRWEEAGALAPPEDEVVHALISALPQRTEDPALAEAVGPVYDTSGVMRILGVTKQAIDDRRRNGSILALRTGDGMWVYPAFQFDGGRIHPGLLPAVRSLKDAPPWASALWFVTPNERLDELSPVDFVHQGLPVEYVHQRAHALAADWAE